MLSHNCEENINIIKIFDFSQNLRPNMGLIDPSPLALIGQAVSEEKMFENVNGRTTTDGRRTDRRQIHGYPISSPVSLRLR